MTEDANTAETQQIDLRQSLDKIFASIEMGFDTQKRYNDTMVLVLIDKVEELQKEIDELKNAHKTCNRIVSDDEATKTVVQVINGLQKKGKKTINVFDIQKEINLSFEQISRITSELIEQKKLLAVDD